LPTGSLLKQTHQRKYSRSHRADISRSQALPGNACPEALPRRPLLHEMPSCPSRTL
jgi:hypothetical protein